MDDNSAAPTPRPVTLTLRSGGMIELATNVRVGILLAGSHDFGEDGGVQAGVSLVITTPPDATERGEWLKIGSTVRSGDLRWTVSALTVDAAGRASVDLTAVVNR